MCRFIAYIFKFDRFILKGSYGQLKIGLSRKIQKIVNAPRTINFFTFFARAIKPIKLFETRSMYCTKFMYIEFIM